MDEALEKTRALKDSRVEPSCSTQCVTRLWLLLHSMWTDTGSQERRGATPFLCGQSWPPLGRWLSSAQLERMEHRPPDQQHPCWGAASSGVPVLQPGCRSPQGAREPSILNQPCLNDLFRAEEPGCLLPRNQAPGLWPRASRPHCGPSAGGRAVAVIKISHIITSREAGQVFAIGSH